MYFPNWFDAPLRAVEWKIFYFCLFSHWNRCVRFTQLAFTTDAIHIHFQVLCCVLVIPIKSNIHKSSSGQCTGSTHTHTLYGLRCCHRRRHHDSIRIFLRVVHRPQEDEWWVQIYLWSLSWVSLTFFFLLSLLLCVHIVDINLCATLTY